MQFFFKNSPKLLTNKHLKNGRCEGVNTAITNKCNMYQRRGEGMMENQRNVE